MAGKNIIVGKGDCTTRKLVKILSSSGSYHLLFDNWTNVCHDLGIEEIAIKKWKRNLNLEKDTFKSVLTDMLDNWVGDKGSKAYLKKLLKALKSNGMKDLADHLKIKMGLTNQPKRYCRLPRTLAEFFSTTSKNYTIISTLDASITCQKIRENCKQCSVFESDGFLLKSSMGWDSDMDMDSLYVVTVFNLDEIEKVFDATTSFPVQKLLVITEEPDEKLNEIMDNLNIDKVVKDRMEWNDLSPFFKSKMEKRLEEKVGIKIRNLPETVLGRVLVDIINDKELNLFDKTIPEELLVSYYIPRVIIERTRLDKDKLFSDSSDTDIFLCAGIDKMELRRHVKFGMTANSLDFINTNISSNTRFIVLQSVNHFPVICRNTNKPVHWIEFKEGEFNWIKSNKEIKTIQKMIKLKPIDEYKENSHLVHLQEPEFVSKVLSSNALRVVCLSDTPGMGKSVLLASIGKQLKNSPELNKIIIFLPISDVLKSIKNLDNKNFESALHDLACKNNLEKEFFSEKLTSSNLEIELLLDGFDEVGWEQIDFAFKLLHFIQGFNSVRLWLGTRPHHLEKLEQELKTIGYNIKPFVEEDQVNFLESFWISKYKGLDNIKVRNFAKTVLQTLSSTISQGFVAEVEIAGIPLQCHMLAQIYEEIAVLSCNSNIHGNNTDDVHILKEVNSIAAMYESLVEIKFQKYQKTYSGQHKLDTSSLYSMHSKLALQLIFPDWFDASLAHLFQETVIIEELLNVGLLERKSTSSGNNFFHRTFAEYFCAWFVAQMILKEDLLTKNFISFFYDGFLSTSETTEGNLNYSFRNCVPCYFLNCLFRSNKNEVLSYQDEWCSSNLNPPSKDISPCEIRKFMITCSNHNFQTLYKLFALLPNFKEHVSDIIDEEFLIQSIKEHSFEMFQIILTHFKKHSRFSARLSASAVQVSVEKADMLKLEYFFKVERLFDKLLGNPELEPNKLLERYLITPRFMTIESSKIAFCNASSATEIPNLLGEIEKRLYGTQENSLYVQNKSYKKLNLIDPRIIIDIRLARIQMDANILQTNEKGNTFLHLYVYTNEECLQYLQTLIATHPKEIKSLVKMKNHKGFTPLATAFKNKVQFSKDCMEKWKEAGVDFNEEFNGAPLFLFAIQSGNGEEVLRFMIENGVDVYWIKAQVNDKTTEVWTYLDYAARSANLDAVRLLVKELKMNVNGIKAILRTPLDHLIQNWISEFPERCFRVAQELWQLGGRFESTSLDDLTKIVVQVEDSYLLKFALEAGLDMNIPDKDGNTMLHLLNKSWNNMKLIEMAIEGWADLTVKNKKGLTPLDLALKETSDIEVVRILKPTADFQWSSVSPSVTNSDFEKLLINSASDISDIDEFSALFDKVIKSSNNPNDFLLNLFEVKYGLSSSQFTFITEYLSTDMELVQLLTTGEHDGATLLHYALQNVEKIEEKPLEIFHKIINFKLKDIDDETLLFYAVKGVQTPDFLEMLSKYGGGDFHDKNTNGQSLLHAAAFCEENPLQLVRFLLQKGLDPNLRDLNGDTPLHCYFKQLEFNKHREGQSIEFTKALLEAETKPELTNKSGKTFFDLVNLSGHSQTIEEIFWLVWEYRDTTQGLSFISSSLSIDDVVKLAFDRKNALNSLTDVKFIHFTNEIFNLKTTITTGWCDEYFPFEKWKSHLTPSNFHLLAKDLIKNGRVQTFFSLAENGMRALHQVVTATNVEERTLKLLQEKGIDLGVKDENGWTVLFHSLNNPGITLKCFKLLEKYGGGGLREEDNSGQSLLHFAMNKFSRHKNNSHVVEFLLEKIRLDPNKVDHNDNTPLHILLEQPDKLTYEMTTKANVFIEAGANINLKNSKGDTVQDLSDRIQEDSDGLQEYLLAIIFTSKES